MCWTIPNIFLTVFCIERMWTWELYLISSSCRIILKTEIVRTVTGLGIFKHDTVTVVGMGTDNSHAVVISQFQIFFINFRHFFYCHNTTAGYNIYAQSIFQIIINRFFCNFFGHKNTKWLLGRVSNQFNSNVVRVASLSVLLILLN